MYIESAYGHRDVGLLNIMLPIEQFVLGFISDILAHDIAVTINDLYFLII